jgi:hypothetical protein
MGPASNAGLWRDRLFELVDRHYLVGLQDALSSSLARFSDAFGWKVGDIPHAKLNTSRPRDIQVGDDQLEAVSQANWLDFELYQRCSAQLREETHSTADS